MGAERRLLATCRVRGGAQPRDRARIRANFLRCREAEAARFPPGRREKYLAYKLEGIADAALNLCVVVDLRPREGVILGTSVQPESVRASVSCAVQNLWLAARAEGIGVGWVSIVEPAILRAEFGLPAGVEPVAYLCVGLADEFRLRPLLEEAGWASRRPLDDVLHQERWTASSGAIARDPSIPTRLAMEPAWRMAIARRLARR